MLVFLTMLFAKVFIATANRDTVSKQRVEESELASQAVVTGGRSVTTPGLAEICSRFLV